ncbi:tRNA threonylcarbamoyladenosine biosynthesis protein [Sporothrix brasiliensis 5110]|uniref:Threonylcarbamoyl-AMP synthase n=1 Tax=Sporothrix brasiliensis 5110 TaxID=1398154 RepID=A0A0C2EPX6_9PEZI|nr:tRNA threonylcarbamoyladenosine biosynthesis protein [Sporothrix brasiliensis 5110]KIH88359.1 tRNA threonylcarbamoyladenosine biosynthesis protein [Sporothrix brasiliensis 5110]
MYTTRILPVPDPDSLGRFRPLPTSATPASSLQPPASSLDHWEAAESAPGLDALVTAADHIRNTDIPVGFPTETVYGLGADATRSGAVRGIYSVKGRPSDNPLIVHVCDLDMLRGLLGRDASGNDRDLPAVYRPLVQRYWPGPLTILLPVPSAADAPKWTLAPEVTTGLPTFGARLPASPLTRTLIRLVDAPLAGPSANASTRPSPTTAQHVVDDLSGRIEVVLDGGACGVGVESTVVDGLCDPPVILRPGGLSLAELRSVPGWERVERAYHDVAEGGNHVASTGAKQQQHSRQEDAALKPRAPGMKYKHYSPKARVVLYEGWRTTGRPARSQADLMADIQSAGQQAGVVGVIRTSTWPALEGLQKRAVNGSGSKSHGTSSASSTSNSAVTYDLEEYTLPTGTAVLELDLGRDLSSIAHGLFSALRDLDARGADIILVEGIDDRGDDMAVAVMNRLRKAASEVR